jgi:hypothetical protein
MEIIWDELCVLSVALAQDENPKKRDIGRAEGLAWALGKLLNPYGEDPLARPRAAIENYLEACATGADVSGTAPWKVQTSGT